MGQSLSQIYVHLTFGTKHRYPLIGNEIRDQLHAYIAGALKNYGSPAIVINSVPDHIHILFRLSKIIEEIKKQSSKWIKEKSQNCKKFSWQTGYGAFSVSSSKLEAVKKYIQNQTEHHHSKSYQKEIEEFFKNYDMSGYDAKYFWA